MAVKTNIELIEELRSEWTLLLSQSKNNNLFLSWEWVNSWCQNMLNRSMKQLIVTVRNNKGLIGLAPLVHVQLEGRLNQIQFIGQKYSYHLGFVAKAGKEKKVYKAIWNYLLYNIDIDFQSIEFLHFDENGLLNATLDKVQKKINFSYERSVQNPCKVIYLGNSVEDYLHTQITSKNVMRNIFREKKRMSNNHKIEFFDAKLNNFSYYWEQMISFHRELMDERKKHSALSRDDFTNHLKQVAETFLETDRLQLNIMSIDDEPAVICFCIVYNLVYNGLTIGVSFQMLKKFPWFNLTIQSIIHNIEKAIQNGCKVFDLLGGQNEFKNKLGGVDQGGIKYKIGFMK